MRAHAEWNVDTHMRRATGPTSAPTRSFISAAALFVKVIARISNGDTPRSLTRYATRCVSSRVLPDPAPAITSTGPSGALTASRWTGLSSERRSPWIISVSSYKCSIRRRVRKAPLQHDPAPDDRRRDASRTPPRRQSGVVAWEPELRGGLAGRPRGIVRQTELARGVTRR